MKRFFWYASSMRWFFVNRNSKTFFTIRSDSIIDWMSRCELYFSSAFDSASLYSLLRRQRTGYCKRHLHMLTFISLML